MHSRFGFSALRRSVWLPIAVGLLAGAGLGLYEYLFGPLFAISSASGWTLPLVAFVFLSLMGTGVSLVLAQGLIGEDKFVIRHTQSLLIVAIAMLLGAFSALAAELWLAADLVQRGLLPLDPMSPITWLAALYSLQLVFLFARLIAGMKGLHGAFYPTFATGTLMLAAGTAIVIGAVFGTVIDRPDFQGVLLAMITLTSALVSGAGVIVFMHPQQAPTATAGRIFRRAGLLLAALLLVRIAHETHSPVVAGLELTGISMLAPFLIAGALLPLAPGCWPFWA